MINYYRKYKKYDTKLFKILNINQIGGIKCKNNCGVDAAPGHNTCCRNCGLFSTNHHSKGCDKDGLNIENKFEGGEGYCKNGCGARLNPGFKTCCRNCGVFFEERRNLHDRHCRARGEPIILSLPSALLSTMPSASSTALSIIRIGERDFQTQFPGSDPRLLEIKDKARYVTDPTSQIFISNNTEITFIESQSRQNFDEQSGDMVDFAIMLRKIGYKPCVHIFANDHHIGGGAGYGGAGPQEENIVIQSGGTILNILEKNVGKPSIAFNARGRYWYDIGGNTLGGEIIGKMPYNAVAVTNISFIFGKKKDNFPYDPKYVGDGISAVLSAAPNISGHIEQPRYTPDEYFNHFCIGWAVTINAAIKSGSNVLVTGLWGGGLFRNDIRIIKESLAATLNNLIIPVNFKVIYVNYIE